MRSIIVLAASLACILAIGLDFAAAKELRVHIGTWNVNSAQPKEGLEELAGLVASTSLPDIIVIGLQEVTMRPDQALINKLFTDKWTKALKPQLAKWGYEKVQTVQLVGILLNVFVHLQHDPHVHSITYDRIRTGLGGWYGNKGAVMISMNVYDTRIRFINAHLPAHDDKLRERIDHFHWIRDNISDPKPADVFFWLGDLNFRLEDQAISAEAIRKMILKGDINGLFDLDQLKDVMEHNVAFGEFTELPVTFRPTFKMIANSDDYNMKRRPAWTDRILYVDSEKIQPVFYKSLENLKYSDHRPVVAQFIVDV